MPLSVRIGLLIILVALAGALLLTARRARLGTLRRNGLVGVRTPTAVVDNRRFAVANRAAVPFLYVGAALAGVLGLLVALTALRWAGGSLGVVIGGILIGGTLLLGGLRGERAARRDLDVHPGSSSDAGIARSGSPARRGSGSTSGSPTRRGVSGRGRRTATTFPMIDARSPSIGVYAGFAGISQT